MIGNMCANNTCDGLFDHNMLKIQLNLPSYALVLSYCHDLDGAKLNH